MYYNLLWQTPSYRQLLSLGSEQVSKLQETFEEVRAWTVPDWEAFGQW